MTHLLPLGFDAEAEMLNCSPLPGCHRYWASDLVTDPMPCAERGAHGRSYQEKRLLLFDFPHRPVTHDLGVEVSEAAVSVCGGEIQRETRHQPELWK